jgi:hypothetical protein
MSRSLSARDRNAGLAASNHLREKLDDLDVGGEIDRRRGNFEVKLVTLNTDNFILLRSQMDFDVKHDSIFSFVNE